MSGNVAKKAARRLAIWVAAALLAALPAARADEPAGLKEVLAREDRALTAQCEQDVRAFLDARASARVGPILTDLERLTRRTKEGAVVVSQYWGRVPMLACLFFDAHDVLGEQRHLRVALDLADFFLKVQEPEGFWHFAHTVDPQGRAQRVELPEAGGRAVCRIQDAHQSGCFRLMLYAWRVTGERKYYESARRCADYLLSIQNENGSWPDWWIPGTVKDKDAPNPRPKAGVLVGGSYNDGATDGGLRMMLVMYHLTKDARYLSRVPALGQWVFDTQIGRGAVRGWCQQYTLDNQPASARHFETAAIDPRTFGRFVVPLCTWYTLMSGQDRYMTLMEETVRWIRSVERPGTEGGWAYQYLSDGTPVFSVGGRVYRHDQPETWPNPMPPKHDGIQKYSRDNGGPGEAEAMLALYKRGGRAALQARFTGPTRLSEEEWLKARLNAARWVTDPARLEALRRRPIRQCDPTLEFEHQEKANRDGRLQWQYLVNLAVAKGRLSAEQLAAGAPPHLGGRGFHRVKSENWFAIPWPAGPGAAPAKSP